MVVLAAAGAAVLLVAVVVVVLAAGGHPSHRVTSGGPVTTAPPPTTAAPAPVVSLSEGLLSADDLGGAWTAKGTVAALTLAQLPQGPCGSTLWANDVAGYHAQFINGGGGFVRTASVTSEIREATSEQAATTQAAFVTSSGYATCLQAEAEAGLNLALAADGLKVDATAVDPLPLPVSSTNAQAYVITAEVVDGGGNVAADITIDHVELFSGRYEGTLNVQTVAGLGVDRQAIIQTETERTVERMAKLPPQGTITGGRGV